MSRPSFRVEVAFASGPDEPPLWVDVTDYVRPDPITLTCGRSDEFATVEPGRMSLVLRNDDGRFTWGRTGSPYYPGVLPGRRIRILVDIPGTPTVPPPGPPPSLWPSDSLTPAADLYPY